jgi:hypothetical protein
MEQTMPDWLLKLLPTKLRALIDVLRIGGQVLDPQKWASHQIKGSAVAAFLMAVAGFASAFGHPIPGLDVDASTALGGGLVALVNIVLTASQHRGVNVLSATAGQPAGDVDPGEPSPVPELPQPAPADPVQQPAIRVDARALIQERADPNLPANSQYVG